MGVLTKLLQAVRHRRPTLVAALGAHYCRYVVVGVRKGEANEPVSVGRIATDELVRLSGADWLSWASGQTETGCLDAGGKAPSFGNPPSISEELLVQVLTDLRRKTDLHRRPRPDLAVTARPDLLRALEPHLARAAKRAGFRLCRVAAEHACIAAAARIGPEHAAVVDVGSGGTRVWRYSGGRAVPDAYAETDTGGRKMLSLTVDAVRSNHGVMIGPSTAADLLARSDAYEDWPRGVHGKDMATNLPRAIEVQRREVTAAVEPAFHEIAGALSELCQKASKPRRVVLAGGAADSEELLLMLTSSLGCPVELRPSPGDLSVMGWPSCAPQASLTALERAVLALRGRAGALPHLRPSPWQRFCLSPIDLSRNLRVVHLRAATGLAC